MGGGSAAQAFLAFAQSLSQVGFTDAFALIRRFPRRLVLPRDQGRRLLLGWPVVCLVFPASRPLARSLAHPLQGPRHLDERVNERLPQRWLPAQWLSRMPVADDPWRRQRA